MEALRGSNPLASMTMRPEKARRRTQTASAAMPSHPGADKKNSERSHGHPPDPEEAPATLSINEPHFVGHFPHRPVMPGVMMLEAMAQTAALLVFADLDAL